MDRYDPYTDKFLRNTQYGILGTDVPDTNVGELISRQAAIDAVMKCYDNDELFEVYEWELNELPPAQPERKKGEWLEREVMDEPNGKHITQWQSAKCSICKHYHTTPYLYYFNVYNFCPNCGAKMEEE